MPGSRWARSWPVGDLDPEAAQPLGVLRLGPIAARDVGPPRVGDHGQRRHAGAADPEQVQSAVGECHRCSARSSVAIRSPASGRASRRAASAIPRQAVGRGQQRIHLGRQPDGGQLGVGDHDRGAAVGDVGGVVRLVVGGDVRRGHQDRGPARPPRSRTPSRRRGTRPGRPRPGAGRATRCRAARGSAARPAEPTGRTRARR